jgi:endonuclease/exonuclease/phosphatase family metal-dependent hydrolase
MPNKNDAKKRLIFLGRSLLLACALFIIDEFPSLCIYAQSDQQRAVPVQPRQDPEEIDKDGVISVSTSEVMFPVRVSCDDSGLLEIGGFADSGKVATAPAEIKIVSYNIRWRGGDDLRRLIALLRDDMEIGRASIIGLQEVDRCRRRTNSVNTARLIAQDLGLNYAWAAPPPPQPKGIDTNASEEAPEEETGVAIFSPFPLSDVERIVLPNPGPGGRRRAAIGATVHIPGNRVHVYSVHAETRIAMPKKMEQLRTVLDSLARRPAIESAVVMGDFNTIKAKDVQGTVKLFSDRGFTTPIPHEHSTFKFFLLELKLDWVWLRDLQASSSGIDRQIGLSDHWPLWVRVNLGNDEK